MTATVRAIGFLVVLSVTATAPSVAGISPNSVAVVANTHSALAGMSRHVADYYCAVSGVPPGNIIEINVSPDQRIDQADWNNPNTGVNLAGQIRDKLISQLHVDPNDPYNDPIQCLVMCYGVPTSIDGDANSPSRENTSIDSYLTMLFSASPDLGPDVIDGDWMNTNQSYGPEGVPNPYYGKDMDFATFRPLPENDTTYMVGSETRHAKMRYMVCRLDAYSDPKTPVVIDGTSYNIPADVKALIDRGHASAGQNEANLSVCDKSDGLDTNGCMG